MKSNAAKKTSVIATLLIMSTAYIAVFTSVQGFKAMLPLIREEFDLSGAQAGLYSTFFYASGVALAIFSGRIVDGIGAKKGLISGVLIIAVLYLLHTLAPLFVMLLFLALFTGIGFSIVTPSINKGIIELVDPSKRAVSNGIVHAGGGIGGILGSSALPAIGERFGWRISLIASASLALLICLLLVKLFHPTNNNGSSESESTHSFKQDVKAVVTNPLVLLVCLMGVAVGLSIGNTVIHYALFLTGDMDLTPTHAGIALSIFMFGGILGNPSFGYINDRFLNSNRRSGMFLLGMVVSVMFTVLALVIFPLSPSYFIILAFSFIFGLFAFALIGMLFTTLGDVVGVRLMGTGTGILLVFTRLAMVFGPPLVGFFADLTGDYQLSWILLSASMFTLTMIFFGLTHKHKHILQRSTTHE